jgi:hypothetical protein
MLVKLGIVAATLFVAAVALASVNLREVYNEMYPVNGLRRDVLGLCHAAQPTFVRAVRYDRENCYDGMPDPVELAIGWVRTSSRLMATRKAPTAVEVAERLMITETAARRPLGPPQFSGFVTTPLGVQPCADIETRLTPVEARDLSNDQLARRIAGAGDGALDALGVAPRAGGPFAAKGQKLAGGSAKLGLGIPSPGLPAGLRGGALPIDPLGTATGCKSRV